MVIFLLKRLGGLVFLLGLMLSAAASAAEVLSDLPYGVDRYQRMDVYLPKEMAKGGAPVIFFLHGGAWRYGDKTNSSAIGNKSRHWTSQGYIFISANTRLLPDADPYQQAEDLADAIVFAQENAPDWGGNPELFVAMGHSAGAHLVTLVAADPAMLGKRGGKGLLAAVALDSGAYDITQIMRYRHHRLFDYVFGNREGFWRDVSPIEQVKRGAPPMLLVCSEYRGDSCGQASALARRLRSVDTRAEVLPVRLSHGAINKRLGTRGDYTRSVDAFLYSLVVK